MATLEKIRSKSVLLFVIIILALLAFILGDFLTSGRTYFGSGTTVAKIGNTKVEYDQYRQELEKMQTRAQQQGQDYDPDELSQMVIQSLLYKNMLEDHYKKLGLKVTDGEITESMTGSFAHPSAQQFVSQVSQMLQLPEASATVVLDAIKNPTKYNLSLEQGQQLKAAWAGIEQDINDELLYQKYMRLLNGLYRANNLDSKTIYDDMSTIRRVAYAAKPLNTVADDEVEVTENDIKAQWEKEKKLYALDGETREVEYVYVEIAPSEEDRLAGQKAVEDALVELNSANGLGKVENNRSFVKNRVNAPLSAFTDARLQEILKNDTVGQAQLFDTQLNSYTLVKLLGKSTGIDSINYTIVQAADIATADSVLAKLQAGAKVADVSNGQTVAGADSIWNSLVNPQQLSATAAKRLETANIGEYFMVYDSLMTNSYPEIYRVNSRKPAVTVYDVAVIGYTVDPSSETVSKLNSDLSNFVANNGSFEAFSKNALEAGFSPVNAVVSADSPHIGSLADSRKAVKWVMDASKGDVSPVISDTKGNYLLAVAVKDIYDDYLPYTASNVYPQMKVKALNAKKAEKLMSSLKGNSVESYASAMGVSPSEEDAVFNAPSLLSLGYNEGALQAAVQAAKVGELVGPVAGNNYVMVFKVTGDTKDSRPYDIREYGERFNMGYGLGQLNPQKLFRMLKGDNKLENNSLNFQQGLDDNAQ